ncbi:hypothetical protein AVEN_60592-1 [Araneus ventricosus]|uniref:Uncharacterized protein n=1 Tax=Araneus ventricosus TaxID=182803 RepID=A0A4Y2EYB9_ARAVE|nr:hypothetical protein AVEN_60592-1 [Araneus ventricosus]
MNNLICSAREKCRGNEILITKLWSLQQWIFKEAMPNEGDLSAPSAFLGGLLREADPHSCEPRGNQANPAQPARRRAAFHSRGLRLPVGRASALGHWWGTESALVDQRCHFLFVTQSGN